MHRRLTALSIGFTGSFLFNLLLFIQVGVTGYSVGIAAVASILSGILSAHYSK